MCGIAAWIDWTGDPQTKAVARMIEPIHHRGPDGSGVFSSGGVTLGHRRLSIIDLSEQGAQPMHRGDLTVTYNGEIYNYLELRDELTGSGHTFASGTDTEVLLAAYEEWGTDCVRHFNGMWSFALHDRSSETVFCSRDRFGEKPFLYFEAGDSLVIASEVKQFHAVGLGGEPDLETVREFLAFGSKLSVESTYYHGIGNLPPATSMTVSLKTRTLSFERYYKPGQSSTYAGLDESSLLAELEVQLKRSITARLRSDVPVGILLSGGIDSSIIATVAGPAYLEATGNPLIAVTASSGDPHNDESAYAREVARLSHTTWEPVAVSPDITRDAWSEATRIIEQPLGSSSHVMQQRVMARAKEIGCTVLLDGQGADESWMGYVRYSITALNDLPWHMRPSFLRKAADRSGVGTAQWLAYLAYFNIPSLAATRARIRLAPLGLRFDRRWYESRFTETFGDRRSSIRQMQMQQLQGEQLSALLRYADHASMSASVEDRLPFLDHHVVDLALSIPTALLFRDGWSKWPLRNQVAATLPPAIAWRKRKIGFEAPSDSFDPQDSSTLAAIRSSSILRHLGATAADFDVIAPSVMWRLFAVALWEGECMPI